MSTEILVAVQVTGLLAILGALIYAIGDVLMLAAQIDIANYPNLQAHANLLSGAEKMVALPSWRLSWGGLLGVFATPLMLAGFWQVYQGLSPAGANLALPPVLLFVCASVIGAYVHGSFMHLGESVHALNRTDAESQDVLVGMLGRQRKTLMLSYGVVLIFILIAAILFSVLVASGQTAFPTWVALFNPVTLSIAWLLGRKLLPRVMRNVTEGAGFNIAYLIFFIITTVTLSQ